MKKKILTNSDFDKAAVVVACNLLGKFLVRKYRGREMALLITEVEVYDGFQDKGSHASHGKSKRNFPMFGPAGVWYIYFTYGMHWMLNIVTGSEGYPAAVLLRKLEEVPGPARLTKRLGIDKRFNNKPAKRETGLWIEDRGIKILPSQIKKGPRIGINYASPFWRNRHWRFWIEY